jgi:hypothetical protein
MGKVLHTREQFNNLRVLMCIKPFRYDAKDLEPGDIFPVDKRDKKAITRARQLYQTRKIDYRENYTLREIKALKKVFNGPVKRIRNRKPAPLTMVTTSTTSTTSATSTTSTTSTTTTTTTV